MARPGSPGTNTASRRNTVTGGLVNSGRRPISAPARSRSTAAACDGRPAPQPTSPSRLATIGARRRHLRHQRQRRQLAAAFGVGGGSTRPAPAPDARRGAPAGDAAINAGTLAISSDNNLGAAGEDAHLQRRHAAARRSFATARPITLNAGGGTIDTNGFNIDGLHGAIGGTGGLTKAGAGIAELRAPTTYAGGTTVNAGILQLARGASLPATGALTVNGGTFDMSRSAPTPDGGGAVGAGGTIALGNGTLTTNSAANTTLASVITGTAA